MPEVFLTISEVQKLLDMSKSDIQIKCRNGILPHYKKGRKYFFLYSALAFWIAEGKIKTIADYQSEFSEFLANKWCRTHLKTKK